nr:uncharacterized protein LOC121116262 [Lepeophtheirus salmonis]
MVVRLGQASGRISDESTALHIASSLGYWSIVKLLLEFGADSSLKNVKGEVAKLNFQSEENEELNRIHLEHHLDISKENTTSSIDSSTSYYSAKSEFDTSSISYKEEIITYSTPSLMKALVENHTESASNIISGFENEESRKIISSTLRRMSHTENNICDEYDIPSYPSPLRSTSPKNLYKFLQNYQELWDMDVKMNSAFKQLIEDNSGLQSSINILTREGILKSSFNYLLLDSRITQNLPFRTIRLGDQVSWNIFLKSVFYIGKGTRSRPLHHLLAALMNNSSKSNKAGSSKIAIIKEIWKSGNGVVNLQVFNNSIAVEALTRESSMIQALGVENLSNVLKGDVYGVATEWDSEQVRVYGTFLLFRAFKIFMTEGERQLKPMDIKPKRF